MAALRNFAVASGLAVALANANPVLYRRQNETTGSPCASVSALAASQTAASPSATPTVPAGLAYECINSVPINQTAALNLIKTSRPYWEWQSTLAYLKDPPAEYVEKIQDAIDVFAELDDLEAKVADGTITKEYEFGYTLYRILQRTHDGHFVYVPDSVGGIFNFGRPLPLVSVSDDGASAPKPYAYPDVLASVLHNATFTPSAVSQIDGEAAATWLENWSQYGSLQDRDALYNNVFYELAVVSLGSSGSGMGTFTGGGRGRWVYPGANTTLAFENGTEYTMQNFAKVLVPFDGVDSGEALYQTFFTTPQDTSFHNGEPESTAAAASSSAAAASSTASSSATATATPAPGYPPPVVRMSTNYIGGYYIDDDPAYADVAVLGVASFVGGSGQAEFQATAREFLAEARAAGKTKLVIDVSANGGGTILLGYDLFKQLFPTIDAFAAADRARATEALDVLGKKFSDIAAGVPRTLEGVETNETLYELEADVVSSYLNFRTDTKPDGTAFESWADKFGPVPAKGDEYTDLSRWNLSDVLTPFNSGDIWVTGYGEGVKNATQPFKAEDIVVMTDGYCASTCTIFSRLMQDLAGVKYVAMGGRSPSSSSSTTSAPITQAIGGVKGTNNWPWDYIQYNVGLAYSYANTTEQDYFDTTSLADYNDQLPFLRAAAGTAYNVNFRDGIKKDDFAARTPTQFVYEPADCRVYWTKEMTVDVSAAWKAVADSAWGYGESKCVAGGLGAPPQGNATYGAEQRRRSLPSQMTPVRRRALVESDYPLDLWTDLDGLDLRMDGYMMP